MTDLIERAKAALKGATPRPWKWQEHTQDGIVGVLEPYMCQGEGFIETSDANARLIALAPDLARLAVAAGKLADRVEEYAHMQCGIDDLERATVRFRAIAEDKTND